MCVCVSGQTVILIIQDCSLYFSVIITFLLDRKALDRTGGIPVLPPSQLEEGSRPPFSPPSSVFFFLFFFITVLHCKMYSSIRRHQYTSAFKYVKLQRGHRCNTVPGSQITICGGLVFLLITPCEMMSFVLLHHLILCILTLLCISFSLPQKRSFDTHIY